MITKIENIVKDFFSKLIIELDSIDVKEEDKGIFLVKIETQESSIVIGPHGKNLEALRNLLKLMVSKSLESRVILHLEVNDYLKSKEDKLIDLVKRKLEFLKKAGSELEMPVLSSYERKKVHSFISELGDKTISTKSVGEGVERKLFICKQGEKLELDVDGDDI